MQLDAFLTRYPLSYQPIGPPRPPAEGSGLSGSRLWIFESHAGPLVARARPAGAVSIERIAWIHQRLEAARGLGYLPVPLRARDGATWAHDAAGEVWDLTPFLPGAPDLHVPPRPERLSAAMVGLAQFHNRMSIFITSGASAGLLAREAGVLGIDGEEDRLSDAPLAREWFRLAREARELLREPLRQAREVETELIPCLRDARSVHFLFEGDVLTGLVDTDALDQESPAADLARYFGDAIEPEDREARARAIAAYRSVRALSEEQERLIDAFEAGADFLIGLRWLADCGGDPEVRRSGVERGIARLRRRLRIERSGLGFRGE